ncbi:MAG: polyprenyl synthetase family protein [Hydrogenibacillus sp.]|nr:polyprenyl synthetase family protein [Hydrogenibacillus sp.]
MQIVDVYEDFQEALGQVEDRLDALLIAESPLLDEAARHLLYAGGKRLRPLVVLISGRFGAVGPKVEAELVRLAAAIELIHMATLVHDDVVDQAELRRGQKTVRARWNDQVAVYTGDYLFARALSELGAFSDVVLHRVLARAMHEMSRGEIAQQADLYRPDVSFRRYFRRIRRKTALLMEISAYLGARVAGAPEGVQERLRRYAFYSGMAFQVTDDLLDFTGTPEELGKPSGSDLSQGHVTLPTIFALRCAPEATRQTLIEALLRRETERRMPELIRLIADSGAFDRTRKVAERYVARAKAALFGLSDFEATRYLEALVSFIEKRKF